MLYLLALFYCGLLAPCFTFFYFALLLDAEAKLDSPSRLPAASDSAAPFAVTNGCLCPSAADTCITGSLDASTAAAGEVASVTSCSSD